MSYSHLKASYPPSVPLSLCVCMCVRMLVCVCVCVCVCACLPACLPVVGRSSSRSSSHSLTLRCRRCEELRYGTNRSELDCLHVKYKGFVVGLVGNILQIQLGSSLVQMMYSLGVLIAAALILGCHSVPVHRERVVHGRQLKIYLPKNADQLDFSRDSSLANTVVLWQRGRLSANIGRVAGTGNDRRWYLDKVTYANKGSYALKDRRGTELSIIEVSIVARTNNVKCVAGDNLRISLEGINSQDATLVFRGYTENRTLVYRGQPASQDVSSWGRVEITSTNIVIKHVNYTDEGLYVLKDNSDQEVSFTKMELVEAHEYGDGNPLLALLLLLGIPAGICCCCRKKIFKKKATNATMLQTTPHTVHTPPAVGPTGPCPPYATPAQPGPAYHQGYNPNMNPGVQPPPGGVAGPGQWTGPPPAAGYNPVYPPLNPAYPPPGPAMVPPAQPPQWNGPPAGPYPPGPEAPMGYAPAPAMYTAPPPTSEHAIVPPSAADPLLYPAAPAPAPAPAPSADGTYTFKIEGDKTSSNFL